MSSSFPAHPSVLDLRPGDLVRVRSAHEIFSTLDHNGELANMPFMPEMLRHCGRTYAVSKRADTTCDGAGGVRRGENAVHLANVRCDGSSHGSCDAACLMYWKEAWLERVSDLADCEENGAQLEPGDQLFVAETLLPATRAPLSQGAADAVYRCQATEVLRATGPLRWWEFNQYRHDVENWGFWKVVRGLPWAVFNKFQRLSRRYLPPSLLFHNGEKYPFISGRGTGELSSAPLNLQPGELVRIKSKEEIRRTLTGDPPKNRGLNFDGEMVRYCGRTARVRGRVSQIIDEQTGKMITIHSDCIVLEGVVCTADFHRFCTRSIFPYWREAWLERVS
jgi:hypothetical protein